MVSQKHIPEEIVFAVSKYILNILNTKTANPSIEMIEALTKLIKTVWR